MPQQEQISKMKGLIDKLVDAGIDFKQIEDFMSLALYLEITNNNDFDRDAYLKWKRKNVTYRGIKSFGKDNEVYGSFGKGLYTVPLSNKSMAKQYGKLYFVVGAIPKNPKIVQSINDAEILLQKLIIDYCKEQNHTKDYDPSFFENHTSMDKELVKQGYDGFIIKGREIVNYKPQNVLYFQNEEEVINHWKNIVV